MIKTDARKKMKMMKEVSDGGKTLNETFYNYYGLLTALELSFKDSIGAMKQKYIKKITEKKQKNY